MRNETMPQTAFREIDHLNRISIPGHEFDAAMNGARSDCRLDDALSVDIKPCRDRLLSPTCTGPMGTR